jgi:hypothetical protein
MEFPSDVFLQNLRPACHLPCCCNPISVTSFRRPQQQQQQQQQQPLLRRPQSHQQQFQQSYYNYNNDRYSVPMPLPMSMYNYNNQQPAPLSLPQPSTQIIPIQNQYHQSNSMPGLYNNSSRNSHSLHTFGKYSNLSLNQSENTNDDDESSDEDCVVGITNAQHMSASKSSYDQNMTPYYYNELSQMKTIDFDSNLDLRMSPTVTDDNSVVNINNNNNIGNKINGITNNNNTLQQQHKLESMLSLQQQQHGDDNEWRSVI